MPLRILMTTGLMLIAQLLPAQQKATAFSDDELRTYVILSDSIQTLTEEFKTAVSKLVTNNPKLSPARYGELSRLQTDEARVSEAKATKEELAVLQEIRTKQNEAAAKFSQQVATLTNSLMATSVYMQIKNALTTDAELKARLDTLRAQMEKGNR